MPPTPRAPARQIARELVGLLLILAGVAAIVTVAFTLSWQVGTATAGALAVAGGITLTLTREDTP